MVQGKQYLVWIEYFVVSRLGLDLNNLIKKTCVFNCTKKYTASSLCVRGGFFVKGVV